DDAVPGVIVEACYTRLLHGRHIGQLLGTRGGRDGNRVEILIVDVLHGTAQDIEHAEDVPAHQVGQCGAGTLVRYMLDGRLGDRLEQFAAQVLGRTISGRAKCELARVGLGISDVVLHGLDRGGAFYFQDQGEFGDLDDGGKDLDGVVLQVLEQRLVHGHVAAGGQL